MFRLLRTAALAASLGAAFCTTVPWAAGNGPSAGMRIENVATASFFNAALGMVETVHSNRVAVDIAAVPDLQVEGGEVQTLGRGVESRYGFRVINTGNVDQKLQLSILEADYDDFDVAGKLYHDKNRNGIVDPDELPIAPADAVPLAAGDSLSLIYLFRTPASPGGGDEADSVLRVVGTTNSPLISNAIPTEVTRMSRAIIQNAALQFVKSGALRPDGRRIDYALRVNNSGGSHLAPYGAVENETILIDGLPRTGILVRDPLPLNTTLVEAKAPGSWLTLYHQTGASRHSYGTTDGNSPGSVDAIAFFREGSFNVGMVSDLSFSLSVAAHMGATEVRNVASAYYDDGTGIVPLESNAVVTPVSGTGGSLEFLDGAYRDTIEQTGFGTPVGLRLSSGACNTSHAIETVDIVVETIATGDREVIQAVETGTNTGIFEIRPLPVSRGVTGNAGDGRLTTLENGLASAHAVCGTTTLSDAIRIAPGGFVFDSMSAEPVPGTALVLRDAYGMSVVETVADENGFFSIGELVAGTYALEVTPPVSHAFPSTVTAFPGFDRTVDRAFSYGQMFSFAGGLLSGLDVPLDPASPLSITLDKTADRLQARAGDYITYTLDARNLMSIGLTDARIEDTLPRGFFYVDGSARVDGDALADPVKGPGTDLAFDLGTIPPGDEVQLEYAVRVGPTSGTGERTNVARLAGRPAGRIVTNGVLTDGLGTAYSRQARATVNIIADGVLSREAVILGTVFLDRDEDGIQDGPDEPGVPGVKLITSNGLFVVTDAEGRYSLFGLRPITQVLALSRSTLPAGAEVLANDVDDALAPASRFIDLRSGLIRGEDFALRWTPEIAAAAEARRAAFQGLDRTDSLLRDDLPLRAGEGARALSSQRETALDTTTEIENDATGTSAGAPQEKEAAETAAARKARFASMAQSLDPSLGFQGIEDGMTAPRGSIDVVVKGPSIAELELLVNGEAQPGSRVGIKAVDSDAGVQVQEYVAVQLQPGANTLTARITDPFGNVRGEETVTVNAPGRPAGLHIAVPADVPVSAGARLPVVVQIVDAAGRPVLAPAEVTLGADRGRWDVRDIRPGKPGLQAYVDNGAASFDFIAPDLVGSLSLTAEAEFGTGEASLRVSPDLDERVFVGIVEGAVRLGSQQGLEGLVEKDQLSPFEETTEGLRGQLYLKGRILGENLLTLRYDSDQDTGERLFRDIARDEYYPVYGDDSERGFDAQSSSRLFVKVEREQSYILYGDFAAEPKSDAIRLGAHRRALTGVKGHFEEGRVSLTVFAARTSQTQRVIEVPGRGVSGPYDVALPGLVDGSEVVEIISRDRDRPSVILSTARQRRLTDYVLDFFSGTLIFNVPVPHADSDLNPVSIRVTYETNDSNGERYWVYGGEARYEVMDGVAVGIRHIGTSAARGADDRLSVSAAYVEADLGTYGEVNVEAARSENRDGETGYGGRIDYTLRRESTTIRANAARTSENFDAPGSSVGAGREEGRVTVEHRLSPRTNVTGEAIYSRDVETSDLRYGAEALVTHGINAQFDVRSGVRAVQTERGDESETDISVLAGGTWRPQFVSGLALGAEVAQSVTDTTGRRVALSADYQHSADLRLYAEHEFATGEEGAASLGGGLALGDDQALRVGAEYRITGPLSGFSEYRDGVSGGDSGLANGMTFDFEANEHLNLRASAEHVEPLIEGQDRSSSVAVGAEYDNPEKGVLLRGDAEWNGDERGNSYYVNLATGYEASENLTLLARNRLAIDDRNGDTRIRDRLRFGAAWRPLNDTDLRILGWYEFEYDRDETTTATHQWSLGGTMRTGRRVHSELRLAGKHTRYSSRHFSDSNTIHMGLFGSEIELIDNRLSLRGDLALFTDGTFTDRSFGAGIEAKIAVTKGVQIGIGYGFAAIEEERIKGLYDAGFYLRLKLKLDDTVWDVFDEHTAVLSDR